MNCNFLTWIISFEAPARSPCQHRTWVHSRHSCKDPLINIPGPLKPERYGMTAVFPDKMTKWMSPSDTLRVSLCWIQRSGLVLVWMNGQSTIYTTQCTLDKHYWESYYVSLLLVFLSYFVPSLLALRELDFFPCTHFGLAMASLGCPEHTALLLFESQCHCSLGAWSSVVIVAIICHLFSMFSLIICDLPSYPLSSRMRNFQSYQTVPGVTDLTHNISYSPDSGRVTGLTWSWDIFFLLLLLSCLSY